MFHRFALPAVMAACIGFASVAQAMSPSSNSNNGSSSNNATGSAQSDYTAGEKAVRDKQYRAAIQRMSAVLKKQPRNVNALNYMGYSYRQLGQYRRALGYYRLALRFEPNHRGANEYLGQLYLRTGNMKGAQAQLARLRKICPSGCEEYDSLRDALRKKGVKG